MTHDALINETNIIENNSDIATVQLARLLKLDSPPSSLPMREQRNLAMSIWLICNVIGGPKGKPVFKSRGRMAVV